MFAMTTQDRYPNMAAVMAAVLAAPAVRRGILAHLVLLQPYRVVVVGQVMKTEMAVTGQLVK